MALNKYMHPRNIYKTPPDFVKLAKSYPEFTGIAKTDVLGKVTIDFKDPHTLRVLTKCLLKNDFGLDVVIPEDRLVPTLPLRLNYILWLEDLLNSIERKDNITGLDIGTGACAVYPLLAAVKNKWQMVGTETDELSFQKAKENIEKNNLQDLIQVNKNSTATLIKYLFDEENAQRFDFSMCNPPFYSNLQELCESRSPARLPPKNGFTGSPQELITEGGELTFCRKMIKESMVYKDKVLIYTTMVGHKYNLKELIQDLKADRICYTSTEFCQGRVTRWGLAWTFQDFDISKLVPGRDQVHKKNQPIVFMLPELPGIPYNMDTVCKTLMSILQNTKIYFKTLNKRGQQLTLDIKAFENTWSNQRRKRRLMKNHQGGSECKKTKLTEAVDTENVSREETTVPIAPDTPNYSENNDGDTERLKKDHVAITIESNCTKAENIESEKPEIGNNEECAFPSNNGSIVETTKEINNVSSSIGLIAESLYSEGNITAEKPMVHAFFKLFKKEKDILLEMEFLGGTAGKEGLHQIMQFIKNNWK